MQRIDLTTNQPKIGMRGALQKFIGLIDGLAALADEGKRPEPEQIRDGLVVLRQLALQHKDTHTHFSNAARSASEVEINHYAPMAYLMLDQLRTSYIPCPEHMPDALYKEIMSYGDHAVMTRTRDNDGNPLDRHATARKIIDFLKERQPMKAEDYKGSSAILSGMGSEDSAMADLTLHTIQKVTDIAKRLGIDTRGTSRAVEPQ